MADPRFLITREELATLLKVRPERLTRLNQEGMPVAKAGGGRGNPTQYDLGAVVAWMWQRQVGGEREKLYRVQAQKVELEIARRQGQLVEVADVERRWARLVAACRERLLSLPTKAVQRGVPAKLEGVLIELVDEALIELASRGDDAKKERR